MKKPMPKPQPTTELSAPTDIPEQILRETIDEVNSKGDEHGDTEMSFNMISELWSTYVSHAHTIHAESWITPHDVAQMLALLKIARSVYGFSRDNYVDAAGYTAIAAMLNRRT